MEINFTNKKYIFQILKIFIFVTNKRGEQFIYIKIWDYFCVEFYMKTKISIIDQIIDDELKNHQKNPMGCI